MQVKANLDQDQYDILFTKVLSSDFCVILQKLKQKKKTMGLVNVEIRLKLQKIDKNLKQVGGEGLETKEPFHFNFIEKFSNKKKKPIESGFNSDDNAASKSNDAANSAKGD